jgi:hypothetical protein
MQSASWKTLGALRWLASSSTPFTHVLVVPDDTFVCTPALLAALMARPVAPVAMPLSEDGHSMVRLPSTPASSITPESPELYFGTVVA